MNTTTPNSNQEEFGIATRALAGICHSCGICASAAKRPGTLFERTMRWHRTWCPAWKAHTKVYGEKALT